MKAGGNIPCAMNAANEIAVQAFLREEITFLQMPDIIEKSMNMIPKIDNPDLEDYKHTDKKSRTIALNIIKEYNGHSH